MQKSDLFNQELNAEQLELDLVIDDNMPSGSIIVNNNGQAFIEFLFILLAMVMISFGMLKGMNEAIAQRWLGSVKAIAKPTPSDIQLR
jgi:hypothetical protein